MVNPLSVRAFTVTLPASSRRPAYAAATEGDIDQLAADHLERFRMLSVFRTMTLESAGFEVVATFRSPHMTIAFTGDMDARLNHLAELRMELMPNPHHDR